MDAMKDEVTHLDVYEPECLLSVTNNLITSSNNVSPINNTDNQSEVCDNNGQIVDARKDKSNTYFTVYESETLDRSSNLNLRSPSNNASQISETNSSLSQQAACNSNLSQINNTDNQSDNNNGQIVDARKDKSNTYFTVYDSENLDRSSNLNLTSPSNNVNQISDTNSSMSQQTACNSNGELSESNEQPVKKGRKVKSNKSQWRKEKGNKYLNKPYRNYKGVEVKSKEFVDYDCKCQMKCREILTASERKQEFQKFWELGSYEAQAIFLIARVDEQVTKKSTKKKKEKKDDNEDSSENVDSPDLKKSKRQFSRTYILKSKQVCRNMFVKTLSITSKRINTALVKMRSKSLIDHRGISQGGKNKISDVRYNEVVNHIKKMPRYKCIHLQGKFDSELLPPELSLSKMYDLYSKDVEQPVSLSMYKKIYYGKFNFKTKGLKKEVCNICKGEKKAKSDNSRKQHTREDSHYPCPSSPNEQIMWQHHQYRPTHFMPSPPINCNQSWISPHNFQMSQHNSAHYFEQPMGYE